MIKYLLNNHPKIALGSHPTSGVDPALTTSWNILELHDGLLLTPVVRVKEDMLKDTMGNLNKILPPNGSIF